MQMEWNQVDERLWELMSSGLCRGRICIFATDIHKETAKYSWSAYTGKSLGANAVRGQSDTLENAKDQVETNAKKINLPLAFGASNGAFT